LKRDALLKRLYGTSVAPVEIVTLKGDASSRQYHRIIMPDGLTPRTLVHMELPREALASDEVTDGEMPSELPFLNMGRHLADNGLRVPELYLEAVPDRALFIEDLGDEVFSNKVENAPIETMRSWYGAAVDLLAHMHRRMWPVPDGCVAKTRLFDYDLLRWELDHYREWGVEALREKPLDPVVRKRLDRVFDDLAREATSLPKGFVHRDYQSRNLMVIDPAPDPGSLAIIDFQDALIGPRVYDLVALLNDSYVILPDTLKEEMVQRYAERMSLDPSTISDEFHLVTVQRKLKDGGRFVFIDRVKNNPSFLQYVEGSFQRVRSALARISGHGELKDALAEADPIHFA
jgi:hypothetical protein